LSGRGLRWVDGQLKYGVSGAETVCCSRAEARVPGHHGGDGR
jgi:hypothetical protein